MKNRFHMHQEKLLTMTHIEQLTCAHIPITAVIHFNKTHARHKCNTAPPL
jgi:hypothetical protein